MRVCVGCSFARDARGNPGEMTLKYAELTPEEARAHYAKFLRAVGVREMSEEEKAWRDARMRMRNTGDGI